MKKNILLLIFSVLLFIPCFGQRMYGRSSLSGLKERQQYDTWEFYACLRMAHGKKQCISVTKFINFRMQGSHNLVDCCQDSLETPENYRCLNAFMPKDFAPYFIHDIMSINTFYYIYPINQTSSRFAMPDHFKGPYLAYHTTENRWYLVHGVSYLTNYWGDQTITLYCINPREGDSIVFQFQRNDETIEMLFP